MLGYELGDIVPPQTVLLTDNILKAEDAVERVFHSAQSTEKHRVRRHRIIDEHGNTRHVFLFKVHFNLAETGNGVLDLFRVREREASAGYDDAGAQAEKTRAYLE